MDTHHLRSLHAAPLDAPLVVAPKAHGVDDVDHAVLKVLVLEDHAVVRNALVALINGESPRLTCVGAASTAREGLAMALSQQPDHIVIDAELAGVDGLSLIPALREATHCQVTVLSSRADEAMCGYAKRMGAQGCIHKLAPVDELLAALDASLRAIKAAVLPGGGLPLASPQGANR